MQVETYEIQELTENGVQENAVESKQLVEKLGLKGQEKFFSKKGEDSTSVFPYRKMTLQEKNVYEVLCPKTCKVKDYSDGIIPVRILETISKVTEMGFLDEIEVMYPKNADVKDPVLIGKVWDDKSRIGSSYSDHQVYILGRWGEVLEPLAVLTQKAKTLLKEELKAKYQEMKVEAEKGINKIDGAVEKYLNGSTSSKPSVSFYGV